MKIWQILVTALIVVSIYSWGAWLIVVDGNKCKFSIELMNGEFIDAREHYTNEGGMTRIKDCNGDRISVPVKNIKIIKSKKKNSLN